MQIENERGKRRMKKIFKSVEIPLFGFISKNNCSIWVNEIMVDGLRVYKWTTKNI